jgi:hypothetical protein
MAPPVREAAVAVVVPVILLKFWEYVVPLKLTGAASTTNDPAAKPAHRIKT